LLIITEMMCERHTEMNTADPLVSEPSSFEVQITTENLKR